MANKPFCHISVFVLASYTFYCVKMSDFVPNKGYLRGVLIFLFRSKKTAAEVHRGLQKVYGDLDVKDRPREGRPKTLEDIIRTNQLRRKMLNIKVEGINNFQKYIILQELLFPHLENCLLCSTFFIHHVFSDSYIFKFSIFHYRIWSGGEG